MKAPIIVRPDLQNPRRRAVLGCIGLAGWILWIYLWLPFATFGGWLFGGWLFHRQMLKPAEYLLTIFGYLGVIILLAAVFLGWALYNLARFRGVERRKPQPPVTDVELAAIFALVPTDLDNLRTSRRAILHISSEGTITSISIPPSLPPEGCAAPLPPPPSRDGTPSPLYTRDT